MEIFVNFVKCAMSTKYENNMKDEPIMSGCRENFPKGLTQVWDYDTFLIHYGLPQNLCLDPLGMFFFFKEL